MRSCIFISENVASIPVSILPPTEYLWHSLRTLLQSGKCLFTNSTNTFLSASTLSISSISFSLLKNDAAMVGFVLLLIEKSTTAHLECNGSMSLFL